MSFPDFNLWQAAGVDTEGKNPHLPMQFTGAPQINTVLDQMYKMRDAEEANKPVAPAKPDATDEALRKRRSAALLQAGAGIGRRSTMLTNASGLGDPQLQRTMLGGY